MFRKSVRASIIVNVGICWCGSLWAANYSAWSHSTNILLNTSANGSAISQTVHNFPVLVRLTSTTFTFSQAKAGGADLRFSKPDNTTPLSYQIERWDATNQVADIWVKVDVIYPDQPAQGFVMHWGNTNAASESNRAAVFDTANGFVGVWHMTDSTDATANKLDATPVYNPNDTVGLIGGAYFLNGTSNIIEVPYSPALNVGLAFTISLWAKWEGPASHTYNRIITRQDFYGSPIGWDISMSGYTGTEDNTFMVLAAGKDSVNNIVTPALHADSSIDSWQADKWHFVTVIIAHDTIMAYTEGALFKLQTFTSMLNPEKRYMKIDSTRDFQMIDGIPDTFWGEWVYTYDSSRVVGIGPFDNQLPIYFGADQAVADSKFRGRMDEIRYEKGARTADWIKLCYDNQKAMQSLVTIGGTIGVLKPDALRPLSGMGFTSKGRYRVLAYDMQGRIFFDRQLNGFELQKNGPVVHMLRKQGTIGAGVYHVQIRSLEISKYNALFNQKMVVTP